MRLAVITPIPTPYRDPFWEVVAAEEGVELMVVYCAPGKADRPWKTNKNYLYRREFPAGRNLLRKFGWGASAYWNPGVASLLEEFKPDRVLVGGYNHPTMLRAIRFCNQKRIPWYLMSESWARRIGLRGWVKDRWLRSLLRTAAGGLPTGLLASERLVELGIPVERQCRLPNVPDIERLTIFGNERRVKLGEHKAEMGLGADDKVILFAARMIEKKRPLLVLEAFHQLDDPHCKLVLLGDGPLMPQVQEFVKNHSITDRVILPGFVDSEVVYKWMSIADLFVQPSSETWGVAPIEALAVGCRVIVSDEIGVGHDLAALITRVPVNDVIVEEGVLLAIRRNLASFRDQDEDSGKSEWLKERGYEALSERLVHFIEGKREHAAI